MVAQVVSDIAVSSVLRERCAGRATAEASNLAICAHLAQSHACRKVTASPALMWQTQALCLAAYACSPLCRCRRCHLSDRWLPPCRADEGDFVDLQRKHTFTMVHLGMLLGALQFQLEGELSRWLESQ